MPLPTFAKQDEIPEVFRPEYMERDGKWVPKTTSDADAVAAANRKLLDEKKKIEDQLKTLTGNRTPEEVTEILSKHQQSEEERARKAGEFDKILEKRLSQQMAELQPKIEAGAKALTELASRDFRDKVREVAEAAGVNPKLMKAVLKTVKDDYIKLDGEDLVVVGPDGNKRSITAEDFFTKEFKKDFPEFYLGSGSSGGGSTGGTDRRQTASTGNTIAASDGKAFIENLADIAAGKKKVVVGT